MFRGSKTLIAITTLFAFIVVYVLTYFPFLFTPENLVTFLVLLFVVTIFSIWFSFFFHKKIIKGAPYLPSTDKCIENMLSVLNLNKNMIGADLGFGDGRVLSLVSSRVKNLDGYEINPLLFVIAKFKLFIADKKNVSLFLKSYWSVDLSKYDFIIVFGIPHIMGDLEEKLKKEAKPNLQVVSNRFEFPNTKEVKKVEDIYYYVFNSQH
ncbi:MAG: hypothetical protein ACOZAO_04410 [Patescibacteria group bacterium]